jgi:hypothetical protein
MTDREKFKEWLKQCPVLPVKADEYANGYFELHVILPDERGSGSLGRGAWWT